MQEFLPLLVRLQDEPIADNVCIPLYFLAKLVKDSGTTVVQVGEGADENFLGYWWCEHYRRLDEAVYQPARRGMPLWRRAVAALAQPRAALSGEALEVQGRARRGEELFWGGAACWWGEKTEPADAGSRRRFARRSIVRSRASCPTVTGRSTATPSSANTSARSTGVSTSPPCCRRCRTSR